MNDISNDKDLKDYQEELKKRNKAIEGLSEKLYNQYPLFTSDLPFFEDWIPSVLKNIYYGSIELRLYNKNICKSKNFKKVSKINFEHKKLLCSKMSYGEELKLWLEKYPKYYDEFNMFIEECMNYYNGGM